MNNGGSKDSAELLVSRRRNEVETCLMRTNQDKKQLSIVLREVESLWVGFPFYMNKDL